MTARAPAAFRTSGRSTRREPQWVRPTTSMYGSASTSGRRSTSPTCSTTRARRLFSAAVANDEADIEALLDRAASFGAPALVVDQPGSLASLVLAVAARRGRPGCVRARTGDAPRRRPLPGRGQDRPSRRLRARRHRPHPAPSGALARRPRRRAARAAARPQRLRRRPRGRRHTALEPAAGCPDGRFPGPWSAFWAPGFTIRVSATCSPAIPCPKRWPRPAAVASHASFGSGRRASRTPLPQL